MFLDAPVDQAFVARQKANEPAAGGEFRGFPSRDGIYFAPLGCLIYNGGC